MMVMVVLLCVIVLFLCLGVVVEVVVKEEFMVMVIMMVVVLPLRVIVVVVEVVMKAAFMAMVLFLCVMKVVLFLPSSFLINSFTFDMIKNVQKEYQDEG